MEAEKYLEVNRAVDCGLESVGQYIRNLIDDPVQVPFGELSGASREDASSNKFVE